ncbi:NERD domain-containing protein [Sporolactobacillus sp. THM7-4]|nr:NERD domain-containing protein [Sporolactobacillus sp. THM7-4]
MFVKPVEIPYYFKQYEAYARRLPPGPLRNDIEEQIRKYKIGFNGEKSIEPYLRSILDKDCLVFHDLRLFNGIHCFQIDFLILTLKVFILLEVKNIAGTLTLDFLSHNLVRKFNQKTEAFQDPTVQSETLKQQLQDWLAVHCDKVPEMPIEDIVVFAGPGTFVHCLNATAHQDQKIVRGPQVRKKILEITNRYPAKILTPKIIKSLSEHLIKSHQPKKIDLISSGRMTSDNLLKGVRCPHCSHIPMTRINKNWKCPACQKTSPKAYINTLRDYRLINGPKITNHQLRDLLILDSESTAKYLLRSLNLKYEGKNKNRIYYLKEEK